MCVCEFEHIEIIPNIINVVEFDRTHMRKNRVLRIHEISTGYSRFILLFTPPSVIVIQNEKIDSSIVACSPREGLKS